MPRSTDRILTSHVGSLPRPHDLLNMMNFRLTGEGDPVGEDEVQQASLDIRLDRHFHVFRNHREAYHRHSRASRRTDRRSRNRG